MGKPYSDDLRRGVVQAIETGHMYEETADLCGVSIRWRRTGNVSPQKFGGYKGYALEPYRRQIESPISPSPNCKLAWQSVTWWSVRLPSSPSFVISTSPGITAPLLLDGPMNGASFPGLCGTDPRP